MLFFFHNPYNQPCFPTNEKTTLYQRPKQSIPQINQRWTFSTNVVFRFSYEGYGLTSGSRQGGKISRPPTESRRAAENLLSNSSESWCLGEEW